jgi:hypothetical protein
MIVPEGWGDRGRKEGAESRYIHESSPCQKLVGESEQLLDPWNNGLNKRHRRTILCKTQDVIHPHRKGAKRSYVKSSEWHDVFLWFSETIRDYR